MTETYYWTRSTGFEPITTWSVGTSYSYNDNLVAQPTVWVNPNTQDVNFKFEIGCLCRVTSHEGWPRSHKESFPIGCAVRIIERNISGSKPTYYVRSLISRKSFSTIFIIEDQLERI